MKKTLKSIESFFALKRMQWEKWMMNASIDWRIRLFLDCMHAVTLMLMGGLNTVAFGHSIKLNVSNVTFFQPMSCALTSFLTVNSSHMYCDLIKYCGIRQL